MQATRGAAVGAVSIANEILKVKDDPREVVGIAGERVQGFGDVALSEDGVANFRGQTVDMLRVVTIFRVGGVAPS
jgi:hypothetical protein